MVRKLIGFALALSVGLTAAVGVPPAAGSPAAATPRKALTAKPDAGAPFDYTSIKGLSQPQYETVRETFEVPAEDGINLHVEAVRPKASGRFGVILELSPYHGTLADRDGTRILPGPRDKDGNLLGVTGYFAPRGYAVVMADLRGTGKSEGCLDHLGANDQSDTKVLVEWAAEQKWSNGRVGMLGHSYVGSTPSMAAAVKPKGLVTIVPSAGLATMYHHEFQDGVPYSLQWAGPLFLYEALAIGRHLPPVGRELPQIGNTGDNFGNDMQYFGCGAPNSAAVTGEAYFSGAYTDWHAERDWRSGATKAKIPVFMIHGVNDNAARIAAIDWFNARRNPRDKAWIGQWDHGSGTPHRPNSRTCGDDVAGACTDDEYTAAVHAWFDKWLLRRDVPTGPPVEIFLNNGKVMTSDVWPPRTKTLKMYPAADAKLLHKAGDEGTASYVADPRGYTNELNTGHVEFTSAPLKKDTAIVGVPKLRLVTSVTSPRVHITATLYDASGDTMTRIGKAGWAIQPELRNGIDSPEPVIPLQEMTMTLDSQSQAHVLAKGHSLVLRVASSHPDKVPTFAAGAQVTVHFGGKNGTEMDLPVVVEPKLHNDVFGPVGRHQP